MIIKTTEVKSIIEEIPTGNKPLKVYCMDNSSYFIKGKKLLKPLDFAVIREFLCSAFLPIWKIPTPKVKGVTLDRELILSSKPGRYPSWLDYRGHVCFGSRTIEGWVNEI